MSTSIPFKRRLFYAASNVVSDLALGRFRKQLQNARRLNRETLQDILSRSESSEFGRKHGFSNLKTEQQFREAVPLATWEDYAPYVDRMVQGEKNVLFTGPLNSYVLSSGTTGKSKHVPTTKHQQRTLMMFSAVMIPAVLRTHLGDKADKPYRSICLLGGGGLTSRTADGTPVGTLGGVSLSRVKGLSDYLFAAPWPVYAWPINPTTFYLQGLFALRERQPLTLSSFYSNIVVSWLDGVVAHWDALLKDLEHGTVDGCPGITAEQKAELAPFLAPDPERARQLRALIGDDFKNFVPRIWPSLCAVTCISSGSFSLYERRLREFIGELPIYSPGLTCSEAMIGFNMRFKSTNEYTLAVGAAYYEFVPAASIDEAQPKTVEMEDLKVGEDYEVAFTTYAGLYRYRLRDVVRVVGFDGEAPVLAYVHRHGTALDVAGEKMSNAQMQAAVSRLTEQWTGDAGQLIDFTAAANHEGKAPRHVIYVELDDPARWAAADLRHAADMLDQALKESNSLCDLFRKRGWIAEPELKLVQRGAFNELHQLLIQRMQGRSAQVKIPRQLADPEQLALMESRVVARSSPA
jgi:hypothetical protein